MTWLSVVLSSTLAGWTLDFPKTELVVKVWKTGAAASLAHDHVIRASVVRGDASLDDEGRPESLTLSLTVDVASLVPDEPQTRQRHHVAGAAVPEGDRQKVKEHMLSDEQLDAAKFPTIGFVVKQVTRDARGELQCTGTLTLHGVKRELTFPITVTTTDTRREGDARVMIKTSDFGVPPYSTALGMVRNKDEVELVLHVSVVKS